MDTDLEEFGGHNSIDHSIDYFSSDEPWDNRKCSLKVLNLKENLFSSLNKCFNYLGLYSM